MPLYFSGLDWSVLVLLEAHGSLAHEQVAAHLDERPDAARSVLQSLRTQGFIEALVLGKPAESMMTPVAYWRLTERGREQLGRRRFS